MRATAQRLEFIENHLNSLFASDLHAKRVRSLACGVLGVMTSASLAVSVIGQALAQARGKAGKHSIKQVDRLLSNQGIDVWALLPLWIEETVGARRELVIAMDWTDFDADDQTTLVFSLVTKHGRATPLLWFSLFKAELTGKRNDIEDMCLSRLKEALSDGTKVTILADRGFGDAKLFDFLAELGFAYVIRFRGDTLVTASDGETRRAEDWVGAGGRARKLADAEISKDKQKVGAVVCVKAKDMKEAWHLAASDGAATAREIINLYSRRWTIEPGFRDTKDLRFGMGLSAVRIGDPYRRDRLLLLQRHRHRAADAARRSRRSARHGSSAQEQHRQTPRAFLVSSGMPVLRRHPQHAGTNVMCAHRALPGLAHGKQSHCSRVCRHLKK